jgi:SAM-dependent methyltransferase
MVDLICPLCGGDQKEKYFSEKSYDVMRCITCGLFYISPYGIDVHQKVSTYDYDDLQIIDPKSSYYASKIFYKTKYLSYILDECVGAKSILDIGCGTGALLEFLYKSNPKIVRIGIELNKRRAEYARTTANCEIYQVPIEKFSYNGKFDVITMINVLSHIPSFDDLFKSIHNLLARDGKLILKVGEITVDVKKGAVFDWGIPDHLHFLGMNTIQYICSKFGFKIIRHEKQLLSAELFSRDRWLAPGRSSTRNFIKRLVVMTPFALLILRKLYEMRYGKEIWSSFLVLSPLY